MEPGSRPDAVNQALRELARAPDRPLERGRLKPGEKVGERYEIIELLGSGGMGEVYRARDPRLGREVAVKVLPEGAAASAEHRQRFEQEARAAGALNDAHVCAVHDVGSHGEAPFLVLELLEGETLRARMAAGRLPLPLALSIAAQTARGLASAHDRGIVHRDLKPENVFLVRGAQVKLLDFGLAKLTHRGDGESGPPTSLTSTGAVLGTAGYMSPEQIRSQPADARSDIFALGTMMVEMLSGRPAFVADSGPDTLSAILRDDPLASRSFPRDLPPALVRIVARCLEKERERRYQSARDLALDLEGVTAERASRRRGRLGLAAAGVAAAAAIVAAVAVGRGARPAPAAGAAAAPPVFSRLTFRRGRVSAARFSPDGNTIVYSAAWDGRPGEVFTTRAGSVESRPLGVADARLLAVSAGGDLALLLGERPTSAWGFNSTGRVARARLAGGAPRDVIENADDADFAPDGRLAVVRSQAERQRLELPPGHLLYETGGWIGQPRVSPRGDAVAFIAHPMREDDSGAIALVDLEGHMRVLSPGWISAYGLAWAPGGDEIWFTASKAGGLRALHAVDLRGHERVLYRAPICLELYDIAADGRLLLGEEVQRSRMVGRGPGQAEERDLSWLDGSGVTQLSPDGKQLFFNESWDGGGATYAGYVRGIDGEPAVRLGDGLITSITADGRFAIMTTHAFPRQVLRLSVAAGEPTQITHGDVNHLAARVSPDGEQLIYIGGRGDERPRLWIRPLAGGEPRLLTDLVITNSFHFVLSPDGRWVALQGPGGHPWLVPVDGGEAKVLPGARPDEVPYDFADDSRALFVARRLELPVHVLRVDVTTGERTELLTVRPLDPAGVSGLTAVALAQDGKAYAYHYLQWLSELFVAEGIR